MAFPYSYKKHIKLNKQELTGITPEMMRFALLNVYSDDKFLEEKDNKISFSSNYSLINFTYKIDFIISEPDENTLNIDIEIHLISLLKITVFLMIFIALFSKFAFRNYLLFAGIFLILFYGLNILFLSHNINIRIKKAMQLLGFENNEISAEQKSWLNDPNKCSACGSDLTVDDFECPSCGLTIKPRIQTKPLKLNTQAINRIKESNKTRNDNLTINYQYKTKDDKTD